MLEVSLPSLPGALPHPADPQSPQQHPSVSSWLLSLSDLACLFPPWNPTRPRCPQPLGTVRFHTRRSAAAEGIPGIAGGPPGASSVFPAQCVRLWGHTDTAPRRHDSNDGPPSQAGGWESRVTLPAASPPAEASFLDGGGMLPSPASSRGRPLRVCLSSSPLPIRTPVLLH